MAKVEKFKPYPATRMSAMLLKQCIVVAPTFEGALVVYERPAMQELGRLGVGVNVLVWHNQNLPGGAWPDIAVDNNITLQAAISRIKGVMLTHGACAEAVRLIGELSPFTEKELKIMADKLASKGAAKAAPAKKAPAGKGGGKGNPEALEKARAAQGAKKAEQMADKRKITLTDKGKEKLKKGGDSSAITNLTAMRDAKTVGAAITGGLSMGDIKYAEGSGTISLG